MTFIIAKKYPLCIIFLTFCIYFFLGNVICFFLLDGFFPIMLPYSEMCWPARLVK